MLLMPAFWTSRYRVQGDMILLGVLSDAASGSLQCYNFPKRKRQNVHSDTGVTASCYPPSGAWKPERRKGREAQLWMQNACMPEVVCK